MQIFTFLIKLSREKSSILDFVFDSWAWKKVKEKKAFLLILYHFSLSFSV